MINHFRTLILNQLPSNVSNDENEEYIDASFLPLPLDSSGGAIINALYSPDFPRTYRNFVATKLTQLTYNCNFAEGFLAQLDPRCSFDPYLGRISSLNPSVIITRIRNAGSVDVIGNYNSVVKLGIFKNEWHISIQDPNTLIIQEGTKVASYPLSFESSTVTVSTPLNDSCGLSVRFVGSTSPLPVDLQATINARAPMSYSMIEALDRIKGSERAEGIFLGNDLDLKDLAHIYSSHPRTDYRLAAILIAFVISQTQKL